jgi:hypothetical protein
MCSNTVSAAKGRSKSAAMRPTPGAPEQALSMSARGNPSPAESIWRSGMSIAREIPTKCQRRSPRRPINVS